MRYVQGAVYLLQLTVLNCITPAPGTRHIYVTRPAPFTLERRGWSPSICRSSAVHAVERLSTSLDHIWICLAHWSRGTSRRALCCACMYSEEHLTVWLPSPRFGNSVCYHDNHGWYLCMLRSYQHHLFGLFVCFFLISVGEHQTNIRVRHVSW